MPRWPGITTCSATSSTTGKRCGRAPVPGSAVCTFHGVGAPQVREAAERRVQQQRAVEIAKRTMPSEALARYADPFAALSYVVSRSYLLAERLGQLVDALPDGELRYQGKTGEHLRGEVVAEQKALDGLRAAAVDTLRLGLDARQAGIR
jgi:hypothetical protein